MSLFVGPTPVGWTLVAQNTSEQTTTSGTQVDLVTISTDTNGVALNIDKSKPLWIVVNGRKDATTNRLGLGLKINATNVITPAVNTANANVWSGTTGNEAQSGTGWCYVGGVQTNYIGGAIASSVAAGASTGGTNTSASATQAQQPDAARTSIIITGISDGSTTLGCGLVQVYQGA